ncbi:MAG: sulfite reductase subunit alpha, partial [Betaproteobacteria bacterium]|nr:sulfite reductase subunit alpha [Betaproteobacteria bacterium]
QPAAQWTAGALSALRERAAKTETQAAVIHVDFASQPAASLYSKTQPFEAEITEVVNLRGTGSSKQTLHLELSLVGSGMTYEPGDSLAVMPHNDPEMVDAVLTATGLNGDEDLRRELIERHDVTTLTRPALEHYQIATNDRELRALIEGPALREFMEHRQLIDLFEAFPQRLTRPTLMRLLRPLPARHYSIASSLKAAPDEAHLLVAPVRYEAYGRRRKGVASTYMSDRRHAGDRLRVYVKPNKHFRLPADLDVPIVMIGPGTGVAPFRAFLQEREAIGAHGRSWLFFGDRNFTHDFLYQLEWQDYLKRGFLSRLDVAFSRDQPEKHYVQHRLWERRAELHAWLEDGAHIYVCGDEKQMAKDVDAMLKRIVIDRGGLDDDAAESYLAALRRDGRYRRDVY